MSTSKVYRCQIEVRGYELDGYGHVNHANYFNYLEHARWKLLEEEGLTSEKFNQLKCWPVVAEAQGHYLKPTFHGDLLEIESRIVEVAHTSFYVEHTILRDHKPVFRGRIRGVMINEKGRPTPHPEEMLRIWNASK